MTFPTDHCANPRTVLRLLAAATVALLAGSSAFAQEEGESATGGRQGIITNQFTAATGGSIGARRPGLWVQQGIAEHRGELQIPGDVPEEPPNFFKDTFDQIAMNLLDLLSGALNAINAFIGNIFGQGGSSSAQQPAFIPIENAATTGQGTTVPIG